MPDALDEFLEKHRGHMIGGIVQEGMVTLAHCMTCTQLNPVIPADVPSGE